MCGGTGASTFTGGLFFEIGTVTSRACRCSDGPPEETELRDALP